MVTVRRSMRTIFSMPGMMYTPRTPGTDHTAKTKNDRPFVLFENLDAADDCNKNDDAKGKRGPDRT